MRKLMKNKIYYFHLLNDKSGSPNVLAQTITANKSLNAELHLFTAKGGSGFLDGLDVVCHHFPYKRFNNRFLTLLSYLFSQAYLFFILLGVNRNGVVFYVNTLLPFGAALAGKFKKIPVIYHVHEISISPPALHRFLCGMCKLSSSHVIFVSNYLSSRYKDYNFSSTSVIYNSLSADFYKIASNSEYQHLYQGHFNILMACSLRDYKGLNEFILLAKSLLDVENIHFFLLLNADDTDFERFVTEISDVPNISAYNRVADMHSFYRKISLVLNLSRVDEWIETFGLTILEAFCYGAPVIAPPIGGPCELVIDNENGYLISSYDVNKIKTEVINLFDDKHLANRLSRRARHTASLFSPDAYHKQICNIITSFG